MVHRFKGIISPGVFFHFFKNLIFWVVRWEKGQKMAQNEKKKSLCNTLNLNNHTSYDPHLLYASVN